MRTLWLKSAHIWAARVYSVLAGFAILAITARWLGPGDRGMVAGMVTWAALLSTAGYLSMGQAAIYEAAQSRGEGWLGPVLGSLVSFALMATLALWAVVGAVAVVSGGDAFGAVPAWTLALGVAAVPLLIWEQYSSALLMALDRVDIYNRAQVAGRTVAVVAVVLALLAGLGVDGALLGILLGQLVVAATGVRFLLTRARGSVRSDRTVLRSLLSAGARFHPATVGAFLLFGADTLIVYEAVGPADGAFYQLASQFILGLWLVPQVVAMALYTRVAQQSPMELWRDQRRMLVGVTALMGALAAIGFLLAPLAVRLVAGDEFGPAVGLFRLLAIALLGMTVSTVMIPQWVAQGRLGGAALITVACGALNVALALALVPRLGATGAAIATAVAYTAAIVPHGVFAWRCDRRYREQPSPSPPSRPAALTGTSSR